MSWSTDGETYKVIFLVGDAPPHMDYKNEVQYPAICEQAVRNDLIINTIQCGNMGSTVVPWRDIADKSEGAYVAIGQGGDMILVATPMDKEIAELRASIAGTRRGYGGAEALAKAHDVERAMAEPDAAPSGAARASFMLKKESAAKGRYERGDASALAELKRDAIGGHADLFEAIAYDAVTWEELEEEKLPEELRKLDKEDRAEYVKKKLEERNELETKLLTLTREREEYLAAERKKLANKKDGFDEEVGKVIREQAKKKGIVYVD
jgi:hypothetical protein